MVESDHEGCCVFRSNVPKPTIVVDVGLKWLKSFSGGKLQVHVEGNDWRLDVFGGRRGEFRFV